jgi:hypothetical protein
MRGLYTEILHHKRHKMHKCQDHLAGGKANASPGCAQLPSCKIAKVPSCQVAKSPTF